MDSTGRFPSSRSTTALGIWDPNIDYQNAESSGMATLNGTFLYVSRSAARSRYSCIDRWMGYRARNRRAYADNGLAIFFGASQHWDRNGLGDFAGSSLRRRCGRKSMRSPPTRAALESHRRIAVSLRQCFFLTVDPLGRFLFGNGLILIGSIAAFTIDPSTGALTNVPAHRSLSMQVPPPRTRGL